MKKVLFMALVPVVALSSCSSDEVIAVVEQQPVSFDCFVGKTSRATDATPSNLLQMQVNGYIGGAIPVKNFVDQLVSRPDASSEWSYSPLQYWAPGKDYFFTAVASPSTEGNSHYTYTWAETLPMMTSDFHGTGTISFDNSAAGGAGNEDLVYACAVKTTSDPITVSPGKVDFRFRHALSRVKFTFTNAMGSDAYSIRVSNLTINNATATADLVLGEENPQWSNQSNSTVLTFRPAYYTPGNATAANAASLSSGTKFVIPGENTFKISFTVDLILNNAVIGTYNHVDRVLPSTVMQNGYSYNFTAELNPQNIDPDEEMFPIEFNVIGVEGWEEDTPIPYVIPNE